MRDYHFPGRSTVFATQGMCATSHPLAAHTAIRILQDGGNAVDAAIAAGTLLGIAEPQMTGLGGDLFALITPPGEDHVLALNASGRAPQAQSPETLRAAGHESVPLYSVEAVTLPGAVAGFCKLADELGSMALEEVLAPAIHYAEEGLPVAPRTAFDWADFADRAEGHAQKHFLIAGAAPRPGQLFRAPGQAQVLRKIAAKGHAGFYEGEVAEEMVATLREHGGVHSLDDFAAVQADWVDPISGTYKGTELVEHPPNGQGATAILLTKILARFDLPSLDPFGARRAHLEAEATKLAYDARNRLLADAAYTARLDHMTSEATAEALAALIDPQRAMPTPPPAAGAVHKETVYLSVVDKDRMAVSLIYSIFHDFGSGIATPNFGLLFHNRGAGFSLEPGHPNEVGGNKRPMHTIIPAMLRQDGRITVPFGVMGGAYQAAGHARFVTNTVDYGLHLQAALDAPRSFAIDAELQVERGYSDEVRAELADLGHKVVVPDKPIGGAQAIRIHSDGLLEGASDPRKDGCALGY